MVPERREKDITGGLLQGWDWVTGFGGEHRIMKT